MSTGKKKRSAPMSLSLTTSLPLLKEIISLQDCYNFVSPNEYSDKTFGLLAFLLRKSFSDINFSDILDEVEKHSQEGQASDFIALLKNKRDNIKEIDASIEKCLIINRLISFIQENETYFMTIISHIRLDMKIKMTDNEINQLINYPADFRQREADFCNRKNAQMVRRLFYRSHTEAKEPPSLIHLKNRTTLHLSYLIDHRIRYEPKFRDIGLTEIFHIFNTSFMILVQPQYGVNPVLIYDKKEAGKYTAKVSVIIISLLNDFMETHPNMIQLDNIEPSLWPLSPHYKLAEPQSISWKTCHLQACPSSKPQIIQYAELSAITIEQTCKKDTRVHFAQGLHSLKLAIKFHVNLPAYRFSKTHPITLESMPFAIGAHNNQISQLLTRVILDDIKRFTKCQSNHVKIILYFMLRYFIHRIGVEPKHDLKIYLEQELTKAMNTRKHFQTIEDIFMDFLVPFVYQVEYMAKHPILAMFYADGLFLGPCNSVRAAEVMTQSFDPNSPKVGLRFNSIEVNYEAITNSSVFGRTIQLKTCAVRVDIYNKAGKRIQYHTFNSTTLANDIRKFVSTSSSENTSRIRILSNFDDQINGETYKSYAEFSKYDDNRLNQISKTDEKYKLITNIIENIITGDYEEISNDEEMQDIDSDESCSLNSQSTASILPTTFDDKQNVGIDTVSVYRPMPYNDNEISLQNVLSIPKQQLIQYVLSDHELFSELIYQMHGLNLIASTQLQSSTVMVPQFQQETTYQQQQVISPYMDLHQSNDVNQNQYCFMNGINNAFQQQSTDIDFLNMPEDDLIQSSLDLFEVQLMSADEVTDYFLSSQNNQ